MNKHELYSLVRLFFAGLGLAAILVQMATSILLGRDIGNFFSFFTIESNILAVTLLIILGISGLQSASPKQYTFFRGAVTLFMTMTGIIYALLLSGNEVALQTTIPWVNTVLHYVMPIIILGDWLISPPKQSLQFKRALLWLIFPLAYLVYSIIRGSIVNWYPYPFINPIMNGWPHVIITSIVIALATITLTWIIYITTLKPATKKQRIA